jgi:intein-encoded DNA endonuclease-like protein
LSFHSSQDLSFVIGAFLGDGSFVEDSAYHHHVKLAVRDRDFAEAFNLSVGHVLNRQTNRITVTHDLGKVYYESKYSSRPLGVYLKSGLENLWPVVEIYPRAFLQGLFSADGCASISTHNGLTLSILLANSNLDLLRGAESILQSKFNIHSRTHLAKKKGATSAFGKKTVILRKDAYLLRIERVSDVRTFVSEIGFVMPRKQEVAERAIRLLKALGRSKAADVWKEYYSTKRGARWSYLAPY